MPAATATPRRAVLDARQRAFLLQLLIGNDPQHLHFEQPLWTAPALAEVIHDEFDLLLAGEDVLRCVDELGLGAADPLLALDAGTKAGYLHWLQREMPKQLPRGASPWWIIETDLLLDPGPALPQVAAPRHAHVIATLSDGHMAWWFCRDAIGTEARTEFLARLQRLAPGAHVLACGAEELYAAALAPLPPAPGAPRLLDPRPALQAQGDTAPGGLFRMEVVRARARRVEGEVLLVQPLSLRLLTAAVTALCVALLFFGCFGHFARTQIATGVLMPAAGALRLEAPQPGKLARIGVNVGDHVEAGQALADIVSAQLDATGASVDAHIAEQLERSLAGLQREEDDALHQADLEHERLRAAADDAERQHADVAEQYALQRKRQQLADDNLERTRQLATSGVIARAQLQELEQQTLSGKVQTLALAREQASAAAAAAEARNRLAQQPLEWAQHLASLHERRDELNQRLAQAHLAAGTTLRAPRAARVAALLARPGASVASGTPLVVLVDDAEPLQAELFIPSRAIGFIQPGQEVQLKLDAFPSQSYGTLRGRLIEISHAALAPRELDVATALTESVYVARVQLDAQTMRAYGEARALSAGMQLQADIVIDRPRIVDWLLEPLHALRGS